MRPFRPMVGLCLLGALALTGCEPAVDGSPEQVDRVLKKKETARKERLQTIGTHALRLQSLDRKPQTDGDAIRLAAAAEGLLKPETKVGKQAVHGRYVFVDPTGARLYVLGQLSAAEADAFVSQQSTPTSLDLHGVTVADATRIAKQRTQSWWNSLGERQIREWSGAGRRGAAEL